jgi:external thioesterase TEII
MKKPQLFLLHFAGGNSYSFQFILPLLKNFDVVVTELPGRGKRLNEPLLSNFDQAAADIYKQIINKLQTSTFLVYGHSMGASLALRVCNMLQNAGKLPAYVIVSGNAGPGLHDSSKKRYLLGRQEFANEIKMLGGVPKEVLEDAEAFNFFEPILRADFEIAEENDLTKEPALSIPLYAIMGSSELKAGMISNWSRYTQAGFSYEILEGDHFFIYRQPQRLATIINNCYKKVSVMNG